MYFIALGDSGEYDLFPVHKVERSGKVLNSPLEGYNTYIHSDGRTTYYKNIVLCGGVEAVHKTIQDFLKEPNKDILAYG